MVAIKHLISDRLSVIKFFLIFVVGLMLFYGFYYSIFFQDYLKAPILSSQTSLSAGLLQMFGYDVSVAGDEISGLGVLLKVSGGCDGIEATALYFIAILLFPISFKYKWVGLLAGVIVLSILNILRIMGLFWVALYWSEGFDFMHNQGGLYLYAFVTILLVLVWSDWALKKFKSEITTL